MILGLSAFYHDSAAALVSADGIVFAAAEERFSRRKHDDGFPGLAVRAALEHAGVALHELDAVVFADSPPRKLLRVVDTWLAEAPSGYPFFAASFRSWMGRRMFEGRTILRELRAIDPAFDRRRLRYARHHESHAASAFLPSPFERAAVLTVDGVGEWATTGLWLGEGDALTPLGELRHPHSLGLLYSAFTAACGFRVNSGEYELMGLAPYGEPELVDQILGEVVHPLERGAFALDLRYFDFGRRERMTSDRFHERFGPPRDPDAPVTDQERALAASIQVVLERLMLGLVEELHRRTGASDLCLAGGVALNGVANGRIAREGPFGRVWVQPAAGDDGGALGAALLDPGRRGALPPSPPPA
ncbi:MAG: carbamoyltransferase, partial [Myxococcales bacterium]|nr:carbamoyltransferase [Myxococcales bacterium]